MQNKCIPKMEVKHISISFDICRDPSDPVNASRFPRSNSMLGYLKKIQIAYYDLLLTEKYPQASLKWHTDMKPFYPVNRRQLRLGLT